MSLGTGPDIEQFNRELENEVKLGVEVDTWWESLDEDKKIDFLEGLYPDQVGMIDSDELWERSSWEDQLQMYKEANGYDKGD